MQCLVKLAFVWSFPPARGCRKTPPGALVAPLPDAEYLPFDEISLKLDWCVAASQRPAPGIRQARVRREDHHTKQAARRARQRAGTSQVTTERLPSTLRALQDADSRRGIQTTGVPRRDHASDGSGG